MTTKRVYLAGPEVFLFNAKKISERKKALCKKHGFEGVFPLDVEVSGKDKNPRELGLAISRVNEDLIRSCEIVVANITPFRGPSADVGTVYEIGFAHGLGKKVFAYTNVTIQFSQRTIEALNNQVKRGEGGRLWDEKGMFIEELELTDNLMVDGCIYSTSEILVIEDAPVQELFTYMNGFERLLQLINKHPKM